MPGPVSDSYDPEFGTGVNADLVESALREVRRRVTGIIGSDNLRDIVDVAKGCPGDSYRYPLTERDYRLIRFAIDRALDTL